MTVASITQRAVAVSLAVILASCSTTRHSVAGPADSEDLARYVLIIRSDSSGQATHEWIPIENVDLTKFRYAANGISHYNGSLVPVGTWASDCDASYERCIKFCFASKVPIPVEDSIFDGSRKDWPKRQKQWCGDMCMKYYNMCLRGQGPWAARKVPAREFSEINVAVDWVKRHQTELIIGSVVVIAGVTLVVVACAGGGCVALVPIVLLASEGYPLEGSCSPQLAEVSHVDPR